jgi:hypothetical protein
MGNFFTNLFSAGASSFVEAIGTAIDKTVTSDEERKSLENEITKAKMQYEIEMQRLGLEETKAYLADTDSARVNQSRVQESTTASWLAKNVQPVLALGILGLTFFMYAWIIGDNHALDNGKKDIVIYVLGALTTIATQVASYFFGSSQGSADKSRTIKAALEHKE